MMQSALNEAALKDPNDENVTVVFKFFCKYFNRLPSISLCLSHKRTQPRTCALMCHDISKGEEKNGYYCTQLLNVDTTWTFKSELHSICCLKAFSIIHSKSVWSYSSVRSGHHSTLLPPACNCHLLALVLVSCCAEICFRKFSSDFYFSWQVTGEFYCDGINVPFSICHLDRKIQ